MEIDFKATDELVEAYSEFVETLRESFRQAYLDAGMSYGETDEGI